MQKLKLSRNLDLAAPSQIAGMLQSIAGSTLVRKDHQALDLAGRLAGGSQGH